MASTMASTLAGSRPSEKFGTHSIKVVGTAKRIRFAAQSGNQHRGAGNIPFAPRSNDLPERSPVTTRFYPWEYPVVQSPGLRRNAHFRRSRGVSLGGVYGIDCSSHYSRAARHRVALQGMAA